MKRLAAIWMTTCMVMASVSLTGAAGKGTDLMAGDALKMLMEGNGRYVAGKATHPRQDLKRRQATATQGQKPFAAVLSCADSRAPVEVVFDQGVGDIFVVRVAGNVAGVDEMASLEYGAEHLHIPLLVVLGHTKCGAVTAVVEKAQVHGHLPALAEKIKPAVEKVSPEKLDKSKGETMVDAAIKANVWQAAEDLLKKSDIIRDLAKKGKVKVVGALYEIDTGRVVWMGPHPGQAQFLEAAPAQPKPAAPAPAAAGRAPGEKTEPPKPPQ